MKDELTKNRRETDEAQEKQVMFATGGPLCPVLSFEQYVSHLNPKNEFFFQRPKRVKDVSDDVWYDNMVVGQGTLGEKMKKLSTDAELSYIYTSHSIRATAITVLDECGYEAQHIMAVSGHKFQKRKQHPKLCGSNKFEQEEENVGSLVLFNKRKQDHIRLTVFLDWGIK